MLSFTSTASPIKPLHVAISVQKPARNLGSAGNTVYMQVYKMYVYKCMYRLVCEEKFLLCNKTIEQPLLKPEDYLFSFLALQHH